jgi:hypothetical protein
MLKETAAQLRSIAYRLVGVARTVGDEQLATEIETLAIDLLKRASELEKSELY